MGEAKQRRARLGMGNDELREGLLRLHKETNGKFCFEMTILRPARAMAAFLSGGDPEAFREFEVVGQFFELVRSGRRPLCLACEYEFHPGTAPPSAFAQCTPIQSKPSGVMVVGVCAKCAQMPDEKLLEIAAGWLRQLGMAPVASGTA
jgi:hypothetical protein